MDVSARRAGDSDAAPLAVLRRTAHEAVLSERSGPLHLRVEHLASPVVGSGEHDAGEHDAGEREQRRPGSVEPGPLVAVAEIDGVVVGFLEAELLAIHGERPLCRVSALYVEPAAREVGAGEALMDLVSSWASGRGAVGIDVLALPGAREVKNFLESAGYVARLIVMHRPLEGA